MLENKPDVPKAIRDAAKELANANIETEPEITQIFLAPATDRVLLVEVDPTSIPNENQVAVALYFRAAPEEGIPFPSGVVTVTPEEQEAKITLPKAWGSWDQLIRIWPCEG